MSSTEITTTVVTSTTNARVRDARGEMPTTPDFGYFKNGRFVVSNSSEQPSPSSPSSTSSDHILPADPRQLIHMAPWRSADQIMPNLFLGNLGVATNTRYLTDHRITHIVSVCHEDIPAQRQDSPIQHLRIAVDDSSTANILLWLPAAVQWIGNAINNENGVVLVHSTLGQSRSAAVVAAYVMRVKNVSVAEALEQVREKREQIWIRPGFQEQLTIYGMCQYNPHEGHPMYRGWFEQIAQQARAEASPQ